MKFSIIVPIYNVGEYLPEMLESADRQTFRDFDLVLVDDGATDDCPGLCDDYKEKHPETIVVHQPNGGLVSARRAGIKAADGDYILFCDGDDRLYPDALEKIAGITDREDVDMVIFNADTFTEEGHTVFFENVLPEGIQESKAPIYDKLFFEYCLNSMCLKATKRVLFDADRDYSEFYRCPVAEDMLQSVPILMASEKIYYLNESLYEYRISSGMTHKVNPQYYWSNRKINIDVRNRLKDEKIEDLEIKAAFHILIAAYAGTTQLKYAEKFDAEQLKKIREDDEFIRAWGLVMESRYESHFSTKQKLILKLLHAGNYTAIKVLLKIKGNA